jgi:hypothetical protein
VKYEPTLIKNFQRVVNRPTNHSMAFVIAANNTRFAIFLFNVA